VELPMYVQIQDGGALKDTTIERRFNQDSDWAGLAVLLDLTRS
jgi:hypothetical protein